jgi:PKD repeat protein/subtilisin-like proprotein convertase family protein
MAFVSLILLSAFSFAAPVANFNASSTFPCLNQSITFTDASTGTITSYSWNFGADASIVTASGIGPHAIFYTTAGFKTISLTVSGPDGSNTITKTNYINVSSGVPSLSGIISGSGSVCANANSVFYSVSPVANAASYNWTVPTGASVTSGQGTASINASFATSGGNVCVTASNGCGVSSSLCKSIDVGKEQITLLNYNLLNYPDQGSIATDTALRDPYYRTIVQYVDPDIMITQENTGSNGISFFLSNVLNANSNTYSAGTFINGFDSDNAIYYKTAKFSFVSNTPIITDLRDINEFKLVHLLSGDTLRIFSVHLKASNTAPDEDQRALEVDSLRKYTNALPAGTNFLICGDFNIYKSSEQAYQKLLAVTPGADGHFIDPITMTGTWNNIAYAPYHTQSTRTRAFGGGSTGGCNDRFDLILFSNAMMQTGGVSYVPLSTQPVGNDGNHYNDSINKQPNTAVPLNVADAIYNGSDHLPVVCKIEFQNASCPIADLGVASLLTPTANTCSTTGQQIQVQVKNYGSSSVNFAFNNLQINLKVDGPASSVQNLSTIISSGVINAGASSTFTFNTTADLSVAGNYTFNAKTLFSGDTIPSNDSMAPASVVVYSNTPATISANGPTTFCNGGSVQLTAVETGNLTYQWKKNGSNIVNATSQTLNVTQSGSYQVLIQKTNTVTTTVPASTFSSSNVLSIPSNSCTGASSTIAVSGFTGNVQSSGITVKINITHTAVGDLAIFLQSPSGEILGLSNRTGNNANLQNNYTNTIFSDAGATQIPTTGAPYTGTYKPWTTLFTSCISSTHTSFATLSGGTMNPNGNWRLLVYDRASGNTGSITSWSITFPSYSITGTLVCDPVLSSPLNVTVNPNPTLSFNPAAPAICNNSGVSITANGASTYLWSPSTGLNTTNGATVFANPSSATTYSVTGTDGNGCSSTAAVSVSLFQQPNVTLANFANVCVTTNPFALSGGAPSGGVYSGVGVSGGIFSPSIAGIGTHTITYSYVDGNGCSASATATITVVGFPSATVTPAGPVSICSGSTITLSTIPGYNYSWSTGATTQSITVSTAGNYSVTVSDNSGCTSTSSLVAVSNSAQVFTSTLFTETMGSSPTTTAIATYETANGFDNDNLFMSGTADVRNSSASSGYAGASALGNVFITNTVGRNFIIQGINTSGLSGITLSFGIFKSTIASNGSELLVQYSTDNVNYFPLSFTALPTGSGTSTWYLRTITGIPASSTLSIQFIQNGTTPQFRIDDVSITYANPNPVITVAGGSVFCQGNTVTLTADNAQSYLWDTGNTTSSISVNTTSSHQCTLTSITGCSASTSLASVSAVPQLINVIGGGNYCAGSTAPGVGLSSSESGVTYQLKRNGTNIGSALSGTGSSLAFGPQLLAGTYTVIATHTASACTATMTGNAIVNVNPAPSSFAVTGGGISCSGGQGVEIALAATETGVSYQLQLNAASIGNAVSGTGNAISFGLHSSAGSYIVIATNNLSSCTASMSNSVNITSANSPQIFSISSGGSICPGGSGIAITLSGSETGVNYTLYSLAGSTGFTLSGNGNSLSFGNFIQPSTYHIIATNLSSGCSSTMLNTAVISIASTPVIYNVIGGGSFCSVPNDGVPVGLSNSEVGVVYQLYHDLNPIGALISGTGSSLSFGNQVNSGNYTVIATKLSSGCTSEMNGSAQVIRNLVSTWYADADGDGYGNPAIFILDCEQPSGYIADNTDCNDANVLINSGAAEICGNGIDDNCNGQVDEGCGIALSVKFNIEGFYLGSGLNVGVLSSLICDSIHIKLAAANAPYSILLDSIALMSVNGVAVINLPVSFLNSSYYVIVDHRNSLTTWSAIPLLMNQSSMSYDFTLSASSAFGNNLSQNADGTFSIISGDVDKNGIIEIQDLSLVEVETQNFLGGYIVTDLTGDLIIESTDFSLVENNIGESVMHP